MTTSEMRSRAEDPEQVLESEQIAAEAWSSAEALQERERELRTLVESALRKTIERGRRDALPAHLKGGRIEPAVEVQEAAAQIAQAWGPGTSSRRESPFWVDVLGDVAAGGILHARLPLASHWLFRIPAAMRALTRRRAGVAADGLRMADVVDSQIKDGAATLRTIANIETSLDATDSKGVDWGVVARSYGPLLEEVAQEPLLTLAAQVWQEGIRCDSAFYGRILEQVFGAEHRAGPHTLVVLEAALYLVREGIRRRAPLPPEMSFILARFYAPDQTMRAFSRFRELRNKLSHRPPTQWSREDYGKHCRLLFATERCGSWLEAPLPRADAVATETPSTASASQRSRSGSSPDPGDALPIFVEPLLHHYRRHRATSASVEQAARLVDDGIVPLAYFPLDVREQLRSRRPVSPAGI